jgi:hypothetical protein
LKQVYAAAVLLPQAVERGSRLGRTRGARRIRDRRRSPEVRNNSDQYRGAGDSRHCRGMVRARSFLFDRLAVGVASPGVVDESRFW